jgi:hypothetical protein
MIFGGTRRANREKQRSARIDNFSLAESQKSGGLSYDLG